MDGLSALSYGDRFSDLWAFTVYGLQFMLAGGAVMVMIDVLERIGLSGKVSPRQYALALGFTFFLGLFLQWEQATRELAKAEKDISEKTGEIKVLQQDRDILAKALKDQADMHKDALTEKKRQNELLELQLRQSEGARKNVHERDKLCENKVAYTVKAEPLPGKPYNQRMTISKPHTILYKFRIISTSHIDVPLVGSGFTSYSSGAVTADHEPISEISAAGGIRDEFTFPINSNEPFSIKCVGRVH